MTSRSRRKKDDEDVPFAKSLQFRANRGNKIKALLNKKEDDSDSDDFWKNNKYFGSMGGMEEDSEESEDYSQEEDVPDEFDEDFQETESESEEEEEDEDRPARKGKAAKPIKEVQSKAVSKSPQRAKKFQVIEKQAPANIKKFIEKDEKKPRSTRIAALALKKTKTKTAAKGEKGKKGAKKAMEEEDEEDEEEGDEEEAEDEQEEEEEEEEIPEPPPKKVTPSKQKAEPVVAKEAQPQPQPERRSTRQRSHQNVEEKPEPKPEPVVETKAESKKAAKEAPKAEPKVEPKTNAKAEPKASTKPSPKVEAKSEPKKGSKAEPKVETKEEPKAKSKAQVQPQPEPEPQPQAPGELMTRSRLRSQQKPDQKAEVKPEVKETKPVSKQETVKPSPKEKKAEPKESQNFEANIEIKVDAKPPSKPRHRRGARLTLRPKKKPLPKPQQQEVFLEEGDELDEEAELQPQGRLRAPYKSKPQPKTQIPAKGTPSKGQAEEETPSKAMTTRGHGKKVIVVAKKPALKATKGKADQKAQKLKLKANGKEALPETPKKKGNYIHDFHSQEDLMKEAALTEILNKKSLENLLRLETDKKDSYLVFRRLEIDEPTVKFISKKVNDQEESSMVVSDAEAYDAYFGHLKPSTTLLEKRMHPQVITDENMQDQDSEEVIKKKRFLANARFKLDETTRNIEKMHIEEDKIDKTINLLRDILEKKQEALDNAE